MATQYAEISPKHQGFMEDQHLFFVATAAADGRVNLSPKGMDSLRVLSPSRVLWLSVTGSGNETAAHLLENDRMTLMFMALQGAPLILRVYGSATAIHHNSAEWSDLYALFDPLPGARQIFDLSVDLVQTSCGMAVPLYDYVGERELLKDWAVKRGEEGIRNYWLEKNQQSIDGKPTDIGKKNL